MTRRLAPLDAIETAAFRFLAWRGEQQARAAHPSGGTPTLRDGVAGWLDRAAEATR
jgi:hypothetical protein